MIIHIKVNGIDREVDVEPRTLLADLLRDGFGLTGTHIGCDTSQCGCCTIQVNGEAVKSCTMLAVQADGCDLLTIEGLARAYAIGRSCEAMRPQDHVKLDALFDGDHASIEGHAGSVGGHAGSIEVHPVQAAFAACHGLQCGFCTPGMIMASSDLLRRHPDPTDEQILDGLAGCLCRCTGYVNIIEAVKKAAVAMRDGSNRSLQTTATTGGAA